MKDIDYGYINIRLAEIMKNQDISINKLACRAEMQRTQLKAYMNNEVQRVDLMLRNTSVLSAGFISLIKQVFIVKTKILIKGSEQRNEQFYEGIILLQRL